MSFNNRFMDDSFQEANLFVPEKVESTEQLNSFANINQDKLAQHLEVDQYDEFQLTDAVRPAIDLKITPKQGYRHDVYVDEETGAQVPVIMASASREILFPLFMDLVGRLGQSLDVVLETSHDTNSGQHIDLYREHIDGPVLNSCLWEFEDLLTNDGCTGIAVLNPNTPQEVQFDEHKLLIVYGSPLEQFEYVFEKHGVQLRPEMQFITEAEHVHASSEAFEAKFNQLRTELGLDGENHSDLDCDHGHDQDYGFQV